MNKIKIKIFQASNVTYLEEQVNKFIELLEGEIISLTHASGSTGVSILVQYIGEIVEVKKPQETTDSFPIIIGPRENRNRY